MVNQETCYVCGKSSGEMAGVAGEVKAIKDKFWRLRRRGNVVQWARAAGLTHRRRPNERKTEGMGLKSGVLQRPLRPYPARPIKREPTQKNQTIWSNPKTIPSVSPSPGMSERIPAAPMTMPR